MDVFNAQQRVEAYFNNCRDKGLITAKATIATNGEVTTVVYPDFKEEGCYVFEVETVNGETFSQLVE
jgi:hypothetical protein